ncbi:hypothetical protein [Microbacterium sp. APC 3901]|uniref:hypothetical protein n=1 Tax=Microbacterium sp. APC 3901 TaxID=3035192 RepID=UPI0025B54337|nr:hypothetical protein [Microbacterium sp. APC 3901]MDN3443392.1 hypothetical protein [Microbacterium sp. APC 3901]
MALSSARLLLNFFNATIQEKYTYAFEDLIAAIADIRRHMPLWKAQGHDVLAFEEAIPAWTSSIITYMVEGQIRKPGGMPTSGDLGVLRWAASLLDADTPSLSESQRGDIREMVNAARGVLRDDGTLPESLRLHIMTLLLHVESVLDNFEVMGDFALEDAVERLLGAMRFAENVSTSEPNAWQKFYRDWVQPVATAILGGSPNTALALTTLLGG